MERIDETADIFAQAVLLNLSLSVPGNSKKIESDGVLRSDSDSPDTQWVSVSKKLLDSKEFDAIKTVVGRLKRYLGRKCIVPQGKGSAKPAMRKFLKSGVYLLPIPLVTEVDSEIASAKALFLAAVEAFLAVYPALAEAAKDKLHGAWSQDDYPPVEALRAAFALEASYLNVSTPKSLERISIAIFQREQEQAQKQWAEASKEVRQVLRLGFQDLVDWMVSTLQPTDGRKKQFRGSTAEKLLEFVTDFSGKNLTNDAELESLVAKAKDILGGADVESLKLSSKDDEFRTNTAKAFSEIKEALDPLVERGPARMIILED